MDIPEDARFAKPIPFSKETQDIVNAHISKFYQSLVSDSMNLREISNPPQPEFSDSLERSRELVLSPKTFFYTLAQNPNDIGSEKDAPGRIQKRINTAEGQVVSYKATVLKELSCGKVSIEDLFEKELDIKDILNFLVVGGKAVRDNNGKIKKIVDVVVAGSAFPSYLSVNFMHLKDEDIPDSCKIWAANSRKFYRYILEILDSGGQIDPAVIKYFGDESLGYLFEQIAEFAFNSGKSIDQMFYFANGVGKKTKYLYPAIPRGIKKAYRKNYGETYDAALQNSSSVDPKYDDENWDELLLNHARDHLNYLIQEGLEGESTMFADEIYQAVGARSSVIFDTSDLLFSKRMGVHTVEFEADTEIANLFTIRMSFENDLIETFQISLGGDIRSVEAGETELGDISQRSYTEMEILVMSLLIDYAQYSDRKSTGKPHKLKASQMLTELSERNGLSLGDFKVVQVGAGGSTRNRDKNIDYIDPMTGEIFHVPDRHWSNSRIIRINGREYSRQLYPNVAGSGHSIVPDVTYDNISHLKAVEDYLDDYRNTNYYLPDEINIPTYRGRVGLKGGGNDPLAKAMFPFFTQKSCLLAIETVLLNQV